MFAYAIVQVLAPGGGSLKVSGALVGERGLIGGPEVRRAAKEPRDIWRKDVEHFARCLSTGDTLWVGGKDWEVAVPAGRRLPLPHLLDLGSPPGLGLRITRQD